MSYILAALKKSEQERNQLEMNSNSVFDSNSVTDSAKSNSNNGAVIGLLSFVIVVLLFVFLLQKPLQKQAQVSQESELVAVSELPAIKPSTTNELEFKDSEKNETEQVLKDVSVTKEEVIKKSSVIETATIEVPVKKVVEAEADFEEQPIKVVGIEEGSQEQLARVPTISITSHIYSSLANRRSIVVNDQRLVEGDFVANQVKVKEITPEGMILEVDSLFFAVSRSRGWNR